LLRPLQGIPRYASSAETACPPNVRVHGAPG
jgi:hypothetical protein